MLFYLTAAVHASMGDQCPMETLSGSLSLYLVDFRQLQIFVQALSESPRCCSFFSKDNKSESNRWYPISDK